MSNSKGPLRSVRTQRTDGLFGKHTSVVDFCEQNYQITPYIAEFFNTISNATYIALGLLAIRYARQEQLPSRVLLCHVALVVLGVGSAIFHATLMKVTMMMDNLPMMWLVSVLLYSIMQSGRESKMNWPLATSLLAINLATIYGDYYEVNAWFQYCAFAGIAIAAAARFIYLVVSNPHALPQDTKRTTIRLFGLGAFCIFAGFGIWNLDNQFCDNIQPYKDRLGMPYAVLLEGHAYWHVLTGIGEYLVVTAGTCITLAIQEGHLGFGYKYGFLGLPYVARTSRDNGKKLR